MQTCTLSETKMKHYSYLGDNVLLAKQSRYRETRFFDVLFFPFCLLSAPPQIALQPLIKIALCPLFKIAKHEDASRYI